MPLCSNESSNRSLSHHHQPHLSHTPCTTATPRPYPTLTLPPTVPRPILSYQVISEGKVLTPLFRITVAWEVGNGKQAVKVYEAKSPQQAWQGDRTQPLKSQHINTTHKNHNLLSISPQAQPTFHVTFNRYPNPNANNIHNITTFLSYPTSGGTGDGGSPYGDAPTPHYRGIRQCRYHGLSHQHWG